MVERYLNIVPELGCEGIEPGCPACAVWTLKTHELNHGEHRVTRANPDPGVYLVSPVLRDGSARRVSLGGGGGDASDRRARDRA